MAPNPSAQTGNLQTADGVQLAAVHLAGPDRSRLLAVVVGHGFTQSTTKPGTKAVLEALAAHAGVIGRHLTELVARGRRTAADSS